jgi:rhodanese-related sulfurtransferase
MCWVRIEFGTVLANAPIRRCRTMNTITTEELHKRMKAVPVALFDVRGDVEYDKEHIIDAKSAPLGSLNFRIAAVMNPDSFVVVYAGDKDQYLAVEAARRLGNLRLRNVHCYADGIEGWREAGLPVVTSPHARVHTWGPVVECRSIIVDREHAYGGAFKGKPEEVGGAGG